MDNKLITLNDAIGLNDRENHNTQSKIKTKITAWYTDTGEVIWTSHNILTIAGAGFLARSLFDIDTAEITKSYNNALGLDNTVNTTDKSASHKAYLFCVGTDGCGRECSQIYAEQYRSWIDEESIVPFQYRAPDDDLTATERTVYFGRKTLENSKIAYYFKAFDSKPVFTQQLTDGTPLDASLYTLNTNYDAESVVTVQLSISKTDCRDFFINTTGINDARINCISLCTAWATTDPSTNYKYYQDIRPCTRLNFANESLIDLTKGITFSYSVYF